MYRTTIAVYLFLILAACSNKQEPGPTSFMKATEAKARIEAEAEAKEDAEATAEIGVTNSIVLWESIDYKNSLIMCRKYNLDFNGNFVLWPELASVRQFDPPGSHNYYNRRPHIFSISGNQIDLISINNEKIMVSYLLLKHDNNKVILEDVRTKIKSRCTIKKQELSGKSLKPVR